MVQNNPLTIGRRKAKRLHQYLVQILSCHIKMGNRYRNSIPRPSIGVC